MEFKIPKNVPSKSHNSMFFDDDDLFVNHLPDEPFNSAAHKQQGGGTQRRVFGGAEAMVTGFSAEDFFESQVGKKNIYISIRFFKSILLSLFALCSFILTKMSTLLNRHWRL